MLVFILCGILSAVALIVIMWRIDLQKFLGYPLACDVGGTLLFTVIFYGTITGMMVAVVAGLVLSGLIYVLRKLYGYKRLTVTRNKYFVSINWVYYNPTFKRGQA